MGCIYTGRDESHFTLLCLKYPSANASKRKILSYSSQLINDTIKLISSHSKFPFLLINLNDITCHTVSVHICSKLNMIMMMLRAVMKKISLDHKDSFITKVSKEVKRF